MNKKRRFFLTSTILVMGVFVVTNISLAAVGLQVGNSSLNLGAAENLYYGNISASSATTSNLLLLQNAGVSKLRVDYYGNLTTPATITAGSFVGPLSGIIAAGNVSAGAFGSNTGGGNYSFPGNVGIGTTNPVTTLDVSNGGYRQQVIENTVSSQKLWFGSVANSIGTFIGSNAYYSNSFNFKPNYSAASGINFRQDGSTEFWNDTGLTSGTDYIPSKRMVILNSGNVGIGATNPSGKLDVSAGLGTQTAGDFVVDTTNNIVYVGKLDSASGNTKFIVRDRLGNEKLNIDPTGAGNIIMAPNGGNVGIGTISPLQKLHVAMLTGSVQIGNGFSAYTPTTVDLLVGKSNGNSRFLVGQNNSVFGGMVWNYNATIADAYLGIGANGNTNAINVLQSGNVGIGTTAPNDKLSIGLAGNAAPAGSDSTGHNYANTYLSTDNYALANYGLVKTLIAGGSGSSVGYWTMNGTSIYNSNSGNVGIGTTAPSTGLKLDVEGKIGSTEYCDQNGANCINIALMNDVDDPVIGFFSHALMFSITYDNGGSYPAVLRVDHDFCSGGYYLGVLKNKNTSYDGSVLDTDCTITSLASDNTQPIKFLVWSHSDSLLYWRYSTGNILPGEQVVGFYYHPINKFQWIIPINSDRFSMTQSLDMGGNNIKLKGGWLSGDGGNEGIMVNYAGNVGIGTTNPGQKLEVNGDVLVGHSNKIGFRYSGADNNFYSYMEGYPASGALTLAGGLWTSSDTQEGIRFETKTAGSVKMSILNNGNVGIGAAAPNDKLSIGLAGSAAPAGSDSTGHNYTQTYLSTDNYALANYGLVKTLIAGGSGSSVGYWTMNGTSIYNSNSGNVGIGTTNPFLGQLHVNKGTAAGLGGDLWITNNAVNTTGNSARLSFGLDNTTDVSSNAFIQAIVTNSSGYLTDLIFGTYGTGGLAERMRINSSGNVGIGTTTPAYKLDVQGTTAQMQIKSTTATNYALFKINNGGGDLYFGREQSTGGGLATGSTGYAGVINAQGTYPLQFAVNNAIGVTILNGGNVGIGTIAPSYKLDVSGDSRNTGAVLSSPILNMDEGSQQNLAPNSNFEMDVAGIWPPSGWSVDAGSAGQVVDDSANLLSSMVGRNAAYFPGDGVYRRLISNYQIPVTPGQIIYGRAYFRGTSATGGKFHFAMYWSNGTYSYFGPTSIDGSATYSRTYGTVTVPAGVTWGKIWLFNFSGNTDGVYVRDVFVGNPDFEIYGTTVFNGNVGIGTTAPNDKLSIGLAGNVAPAGSDSTGHNYANTYLSTDNYALANYGLVKTLIAGGSGSSVGYWTMNGTSIYNSNSGNVGIGTTAPKNKLSIYNPSVASVPVLGASGQTLGVLGDGNNYGLVGGVLGNGNTYLQSQRVDGTATAYSMLLQPNGGNVGVGTTNPAGKLHLYTDDAGADDANELVVIEQAGTGDIGIDFLFPGVRRWRLGIDNSDSDKLKISNGANFAANTLFTLDNSGNVGIGTTNPIVKLQVEGVYGLPATSGTTQANGVGRFGYATGNAVLDIGVNGGSGAWLQSTNKTNLGANYPILLNPNGGNVGIGLTAPSERLHVSNGVNQEVSFNLGENNIAKFTTAANGSLTINADVGGSDGSMALQARGLTHVYLNGTGNVGIGTIAPNDKFSIGMGGVAAPAGSDGTGHNNTQTYVGTDNYALANVGYVKSLMSGSYLPLSGGTMTGDVNFGGRNITNLNGLTVSKITATTIDPLYNIRGINYSTFAPSISGGVKEEYVGKASIKRYNSEAREYEYVVDFDLETEGSDLWVWRQVVDYSDSNVQVTITPSGKFAAVYYLVRGNQLVLRSDRAVEVSYRLIANRYDWRDWPTKANDQSQMGVIIK